MKEKIIKLYHSEGLRYLFIGGCTTLVNLILFWLLTEVAGMETKLLMTVANVISVVVSILFAYIANKLFVFESHVDTMLELVTEFLKFIGGRAATMILEVGGVYLLVNMIGQDKMIGKLETQVLVILGNYFISKWFVFTKTERTED